MDLYILENISIILITSVVILLLFNKLKLPSMIGLFLTGIILGQFIDSTSIITNISELGVIFLLFIIGLEFSIEKFSAIKRYAVLGGILQVVLTTILVTLILFIGKAPLNQSIFMGFLVCFSSTAIVMKILQKKRLAHSIQGRVTLGILIFQDLAVILVILLTPVLGGQSIDLSTLPTTLLKLVGFVIIIAVSAKWIVPIALNEAAKTKNRDLFMLLILFICLGTTFATSSLGISPELGAFLAGLIISNTEFSHQALGYVQPFQDVFMSIFLISIGLMINVSYFINNILLIIALAAIVLVIKFVATFLTGVILKLPIKTTVAISVLLSQIGEFSFILAEDGMKYGLISGELFTTFLTVTIITMSATPLLEKITPRLVGIFKKIPYFQVDEELKTIQPAEIEENELEDHVIIVGFGVNGRNLSSACETYNIPYVIVDFNPQVVEKNKALGLPIIYGNGYDESVLKELRIKSAKCIVISMPSYDSTIKAVDSARRLNPDIHIIVRTRFLKNVDEVYEAGADEVIPEEYETSIIMFTRVMDYYDKDIDEINSTIESLRSDDYDTFRHVSSDDITTSLSNRVTDLNMESVQITRKQKISDIDFNRFNLTVTSVIRNNKTFTEIDARFNLKIDDLVIFTGTSENISSFLRYFHVTNEI